MNDISPWVPVAFVMLISGLLMCVFAGQKPSRIVAGLVLLSGGWLLAWGPIGWLW